MQHLLWALSGLFSAHFGCLGPRTKNPRSLHHGGLRVDSGAPRNSEKDRTNERSGHEIHIPICFCISSYPTNFQNMWFHVLWLWTGNSLKKTAAATNLAFFSRSAFSKYTIYILYTHLFISSNLETSRSPSRRCWRQVGESEADFYILFTGTGTANVSWMDGRKQHGDGRCDGSALGWGWLGLVKRCGFLSCLRFLLVGWIGWDLWMTQMGIKSTLDRVDEAIVNWVSTLDR